MAKIAAIGCYWPSALLTAANTDTYWKGQGASNLAFMQDVACNIGLATWYYFYNATGNGGSGCTCTGCTGRFAALMGLGTSYARPSPGPFQESLAPEVSKYCK